MTTAWSFYGRTRQLTTLTQVLDRGRFFFVRVTRRRRVDVHPRKA